MYVDVICLASFFDRKIHDYWIIHQPWARKNHISHIFHMGSTGLVYLPTFLVAGFNPSEKY